MFLADVRWYLDGRSGRASYEGGHLPGAVFVDLSSGCPARAGQPSAAILCPILRRSPGGWRERDRR